MPTWSLNHWNLSTPAIARGSRRKQMLRALIQEWDPNWDPGPNATVHDLEFALYAAGHPSFTTPPTKFPLLTRLAKGFRERAEIVMDDLRERKRRLRP